MKFMRLLSLVGMAALIGCSGSDGADGTTGTNGTNGTDGVSCTIADNGDGTKTVTCDDGTTATITDGTDGADCTVADNGDGTKTISCDDGTSVTVTDGDDAVPGVPTLEGHNGNHGNILGYDVQAAYNNDTMFVRVTYRGNEGKRHQYLHYDGTKWVKEGGDRRDAQGAIDGDTDQGDQTQNTTIYEQRTSIMWNDPSATPNVTNFGKFGCYLTCHDDSRHMPEWNSANGHDSKWVDPAQVSGYAAGTADKVLDLWHWRGARSNPIAMADDQYIKSLPWAGSTSGSDDGGRKGDGPKDSSVFFNQGLDGSGNPEYLLDPATTWGSFTFPWEQFWQTPFYYMTMPEAASMGHTTPNPTTIPYADAVTAGYAPTAGDTVPRRILRPGFGSRADITAHGTTFTPESPDGRLGVWRVQMQRKLTNGNDDDVQLVAGNTYEVGFEVHLWEYTTRDHYISFPMTLSLGTGGDIEAVNISGNGTFPLPDWNNTAMFPVKRVYLFQPGINSWEFLSGQDTAKVFTDPVTGSAVDQAHGGASSLTAATPTNGCTSCHTVRKVDPAPPVMNAGSMEALAGQRGGIWSDTPTDAP